jgi:glycerophosphoryl diester phosphodiesterase
MFVPDVQAAEPLVIAHRGASFDAPENTVAAIELAWKHGADGIELDFQLTMDGEVVCIHDADTARTAQGKTLKIQQSTLEELRGLDVGSFKAAVYQGEKVPTLAETLAAVPPGKLIFVEMKSGPEIVAPLVAGLRKSQLKPEQIILKSLDVATTAAARKAMPEVRTFWLGDLETKDRPPRPVSAESICSSVDKLDLGGVSTKGDPRLFTAQMYQEFRRRGIKEIAVWTVNDAATARYHRDQGVDFILTDKPSELRRWLEKKRQPEAQARE